MQPIAGKTILTHDRMNYDELTHPGLGGFYLQLGASCGKHFLVDLGGCQDFTYFGSELGPKMGFMQTRRAYITRRRLSTRPLPEPIETTPDISFPTSFS